MRRRELLRTVLLILAGGSPGVAGELTARSAGPMPDGVDPAAQPAASQPLSDAERETLLVFAEVLVADRPLAAPERGELRTYIVDRVRANEDTLALYRDAAALLDRRAGVPFSSLGVSERLAVVMRHRLVPSRGIVEPPDDAATPVRKRVAPDLIAGYYGSAIGWAIVGYGVFPGRCGDLVRYTRPEP